MNRNTPSSATPSFKSLSKLIFSASTIQSGSQEGPGLRVQVV